MNLEKNRAKARKWYNANKDHHRMVRRARQAAYPREKLWRMARDRAKRKGVEFTISVEDIVIPQCCPVLGMPLRAVEGKRGPGSPSLDRVDNTLGYIPGNIKVISSRANHLKNDASIEELEAVLKYMIDNRF